MSAPIQEILDGLPLAACIVRHARIEAANARLCELLGYTCEELLASKNAALDFIDGRDAERLFTRTQARERGEDVPENYVFAARRRDGSAVHARAHVSRFPLAGPHAFLFTCVEEDDREAREAVIRSFVDIAVVAQRQTNADDLFALIRERLEESGLSPTLAELDGDRFRFLFVGGEPADEIRERWPGWAPMGTFVQPPRVDDQGYLLDDVPGMMAGAFGRPRAEFAGRMPDRAVVARIPVAGAHRYVLSCSGGRLDTTVATAFGLFCQQLGAALETIGRVEQLHRSNRELIAVNEVARASATLGSGRTVLAALEQLVGSLDIDSAALFARDGERLLLIGQQGFDPGWVATARRLPVDGGSPWGEAATRGQPVLFQLDERGSVGASGRRIVTPKHGVARLVVVPGEAGGAAPELRHPEAPSCVALPLRVGNEVSGVLVAARRDRPLGDDDLRLLGTVAAQVAVSLQNAALFEQAQRRVDELSLLLELGQEVVGALDLSQVLQVAAKVATRVLRCRAAYVFLPDETGANLRTAAVLDPDLPAMIGSLLPLQESSLTALAFYTRRPHSTADATMDPRIDAELSRQYRCRSTLAVPLLSHDRSLGVLMMLERSERVFGPQDVRLASHAAQLVAAALESAELFDHEKRRADEMALLQELSQATAGKLDPRELQETALLRLESLMSADAAAIYLKGDDGSLHLASARAREGRLEGIPQHLEVELESTGRLPRLEEMVRPSCRVLREGQLPLGIQRCLALPLHPSGALWLGRAAQPSGHTASRDFSADELRLATGVCAQLAVAIDNSRLYAQERARAEEMTLLNDVARSLAGSLEVRPLLELAGETLCKLVDATHWFALLLDPKQRALRAVAASLEGAQLLREAPLPLDGPSLVATVARERRPIQLSAPDASGDAEADAGMLGPHRALAVPLVARDQILGVLVLQDLRQGRVFSAAEVERATAVCGQLALALLSARLYEDLRTSYAELARTQADLVDRERLAALGELSASIAHEVRNPLGVIFNSLGSLRKILRPEGDVALLLGIVGEEADRLNRMVGDLLDYSRPVRPALQPLQLSALLAEAVAATRQQAGASGALIETQVKVEAGVATLRADARLLRQALVNLFLNAFQAMPRGGRLVIEARRGQLLGAPAADLCISDTGAGVAPEARAKIWQPFFTTKATGTGLGLAVVKRIVEGHGGRIELASADRGAEFRLLVPLRN